MIDMCEDIDIDEDEAMSLPTKFDNDNDIDSFVLEDGSLEDSLSDSSLLGQSESSLLESGAGGPKKSGLRKLKKLGKKTVVGTSRITKKMGKCIRECKSCKNLCQSCSCRSLILTLYNFYLYSQEPQN